MADLFQSPFALSVSKGFAEPQVKPLRFAQLPASTSLSPNGKI
jgi:hypothetical protein